MNTALFHWDEQVLQRFGISRLEAMREARRLTYRFSNRSELSLPKYISRKTTLLREAGITSDIDLVMAVREGLEAQLQVACPIDEWLQAFATLNTYSRTLRAQWSQLLFVCGNLIPSWRSPHTRKIAGKNESKPDFKNANKGSSNAPVFSDRADKRRDKYTKDKPYSKYAVKANLANSSLSDQQQDDLPDDPVTAESSSSSSEELSSSDEDSKN
ncbi:hypothetical protein ACJ73_09543 [Blastomyces percursus]|uniref:Uncharacterized protein n=1 Tax=Blastomyces percursus TaxID=1658174 RepID=A0A1J9Q8A9_9EURO|nr:hypothetical protein ACJ73_09543 [Blastomyces percursus]